MPHQHQYIEIKSGKTPGNFKYKDVACADCGRTKRMTEDGHVAVMKKGKRAMQGEEPVAPESKPPEETVPEEK